MEKTSKTKSLMFKTTVNSGGRLSPQSPRVTAGMRPDGIVCNYRVDAVPIDVPAAEVMQLLDECVVLRKSCICSYLELSPGAIIRD